MSTDRRGRQWQTTPGHQNCLGNPDTGSPGVYSNSKELLLLLMSMSGLKSQTELNLIYFTFMLLCITIDLFLTNQPDALIIPILFRYKTLNVSGILSAHHQEFSTVHLALVTFMQVSDDRFQAESGWNCVPS